MTNKKVKIQNIKSHYNELVLDYFAGGGGASEGIEEALHRPIDIAVNHDKDAIAMHQMNHPNTVHYQEDVFLLNPYKIAQGKPVGLMWFSPDCKHFSKAKGSAPVSKKIRGLAWVAVKWAKTVRPRVIILENVEEFKTWGPLIEKNGKMYPDPKRKGETFEKFIQTFKNLGYDVEYRELRACDYGAPTTRKRFFMIARCDGTPIVWPSPTHGPKDSLFVQAKQLLPYRSAAECIDWNIEGKSIFNRKKPLAENTLKRIARGMEKFILNDPNPFIVRIGQTKFGKDRLTYSSSDPLTTITSKAEHCIVMPSLVVNTTSHPGGSIKDPLKTITTGSHHGLLEVEAEKVDQTADFIAPFIMKCYGGTYSGAGIDVRNPTDTITQIDHHALVNAFLVKYYGNEDGQSLNSPMHTITSKERFGLVTIEGQEYQINDIKFRMLEPHELAKAQGVPEDYILDKDPENKKIPKYKQVARIGNMVVPQCAKALVEANVPELISKENLKRKTINN